MAESTIYLNSKRITEMDPLVKLGGTEEVLVDNGEETFKVTVDALLGYMANRLNEASGIPASSSTGSGIHIIPKGTTLPAASRVPGDYYLRVVDTKQAKDSAVQGVIRVSPNMGLKIVQD